MAARLRLFELTIVSGVLASCGRPGTQPTESFDGPHVRTVAAETASIVDEARSAQACDRIDAARRMCDDVGAARANAGLLVGLLHDPSAGVRAEACRALGGLAKTGQLTDDQIEALATATQDDHVAVRAMAIASLACVPSLDETHAAMLRKLAFEGAPACRAAAIGAVERPGRRGCVEDLRKLIADPDTDVRRAALCAASRLRDEGSALLPDLLAMAEDPRLGREPCLVDAIAACGRGSDSAVLALRKLLSDPEWFTRHKAATALGSMGSDANAAKDDLLALRDDPNDVVRRDVEDALRSLAAAPR